ncbi:sensor histidine kinase [Evansella cellulosilytica]|uniref:Integral membrane sensor signal transduction histidine kinase n=1 Tax=Evansella cellulosilytica (strain ATCC 21833 / DSM 2522 / FERM P-1141 / JCM 9156 / N-4) TaxID=649639 RepID=E6TXL1_EVAC2|nr:sensor histidine kinase [Evansella cellulosilytica]ADU28825.1 integral membrane sensor signal transduction histidine kinase [Evansella cellulosilytica DSM 2522]
MLPSKYNFNNMKLRNKLLLLYIFCVFLPIVITNIVFFNVTSNNIKNQKMHDVELVLDQITNDFTDVVDQAVGLTSRLYVDYSLYEYFEADYESTLDYVEAYGVFLRNFHRYSSMYYTIQSITFYTDNENIIYAGGVRPINDETKKEEWYTYLNEVDHPIVIRTNPLEDSDRFSVFREYDFYKNLDEKEKIIRVDINSSTINQIFHNVTLQGNIYLLNENNEIEFSTDENIQWQTEQIGFDSVNMPEDTIFLEERNLPHNYFEDWKIVGVISENEILEELYNSRQFIVILASINIILPTLLIILISKSIHTRLLRLLKHMKMMKRQKFDLIAFADDKDEIGEVMTEFNKMSKTINKLINEVYVANLEKKDSQLREKQAQLSALQSQINPHFLFNALETIRMRSVIKEEKETAQIIQNMASIFRNSLTWGKDWVSVREEVDLIISFLEIQKYRFGNKLEYELEIEDSAYECIVPNLIFLPFVENASMHGIELKKQKGKIQIVIKNINQQLVFKIEDDGVGIEKEELAKILKNLKDEDSMGDSVGIKNVYYRLKLYYKNNFEFSIKSASHKGTIVEMKLPFQKD